MRTKGGDEVWVYPSDKPDRIQGCIVRRDRYPWSTEEHRVVSEWFLDGRMIVWRSAMFGYWTEDNPDDLVMESE